ncbi:cyclin-domain-containing protein, partial [Meira miltonrushii]
EENVKTLPPLFEDSDPEDIVILVADMLNRLTTHNDSLPLHPSSLTRFHSRAAPGITILSYLRRIAKYTSLEKSCMLILLVYIDRVCQRIAGFTICSLTVHRFVCAAVVCSSKALCDAFSTNGHYARVGGISLIELNMLEKEFLNIIDWKLSCSGALLQHYYTSLVRSHES